MEISVVLIEGNYLKTGRLSFIRYPGGKQRMVDCIMPHLPRKASIRGRFVEPFLGGGAVFFLVEPESALLADLNEELITLYQGIKLFPKKVWEIFNGFPATKEAYYQIRDAGRGKHDIAFTAARTLYLNRTCFKGMWRHNSNGQFNVGYGGQARRWAITQDSLVEVSNRLCTADLICSDFQPIIDMCEKGDFIFADPPYCPGERELVQLHYVYNKFSFAEHDRLAKTLLKATRRGVQWALTISSHPDILQLYNENRIVRFSKGTGRSPGILTKNPGEVLICNYGEASDEGLLRQGNYARPPSACATDIS
ncbi:MAG: Dam family site-specific DNA-(adenine-N6)-methyltransferase [Dehalococcoidia bacterium]